MARSMDEGKRVYIQSYSGTGEDTEISHLDGTKIEGVSSATIWIEAGEIHRVDLTINKPAVDIRALLDEVTLTCPVCKEDFRHECPAGGHAESTSRVCEHEGTLKPSLWEKVMATHSGEIYFTRTLTCPECGIKKEERRKA